MWSRPDEDTIGRTQKWCYKTSLERTAFKLGWGWQGLVESVSMTQSRLDSQNAMPAPVRLYPHAEYGVCVLHSIHRYQSNQFQLSMF